MQTTLRSLVTETRETVFALDPEVVRALRTDDGIAHSTELRLSYASGHTTGASETWHNKRGDCLSLTILAYASARYLGIDAHMQEVKVIIDFEPQAGARRSGQWLIENAIMARYYSNRATEYLVKKNDARAYAYYRAAIEAEPDFAPTFANLAQLYAKHGLSVHLSRWCFRPVRLRGGAGGLR